MIPALALYAAAVLLIGLAARRAASGSSAAFLVGDRSFGPGATWAALSSTTIGGSTTLVLAALVGRVGVPGIWLDLAGALGLLLLAAVLAVRVRESGALTLAAVVGQLYGDRVRRVAALLVVLSEIVWFALLTQATETVVTAMTPFPPDTVLVVTAVVFVAYTALGGQRAVVQTDVLQFGLMGVALVGVAAPLAVSSLVRTGIPPRLLHFPVGPGLSWADVLAFLVLVGLPHAVGSDVWSKILSARDGRTARTAALGAAASKLLFGSAVLLIALAGAARGVGGAPAALFPRTVLELSGPNLAPLLLVALVATMQSSSDSVLLSAAAATAHDLVRSGSRLAAQLLVVFYGALGLLVALALRDLVETFRLGYTLFASGLILPVLAAFLPGVRIVPLAAGTAMVAGGCAALVERAFHPLGIDPVLAGTAVNGLVLLAGVRRRPRPGGEGPLSPGR